MMQFPGNMGFPTQPAGMPDRNPPAFSGGFGGRRSYQPPPSIAWRDTRGAMNNQLAAGAQSAAQRVGAGAGLSAGRGQRHIQSVRGGAAMANAVNAAMGTQMQDAFANAGATLDYQAGAANEDLSYRRLEQQRRQGDWDSRFNNLTSIWGALSGLIR